MKLSNTQLGWPRSCFQWVYAIVAPIAGAISSIAVLVTWNLSILSPGLAGRCVGIRAFAMSLRQFPRAGMLPKSPVGVVSVVTPIKASIYLQK